MEKTALIIAIAALIVAVGAVLFLIFGGSLAETMLVRYSAGNNTATSSTDATKKTAATPTITAVSGTANLPQLEKLKQQLPPQCQYVASIFEGQNGKQTCEGIAGGKTCAFAFHMFENYSYTSTDNTCSGSIQDKDIETWPMACTDFTRSKAAGDKPPSCSTTDVGFAEPEKGDYNSRWTVDVAICCDL